jgi:hypothetical protein
MKENIGNKSYCLGCGCPIVDDDHPSKELMCQRIWKLSTENQTLREAVGQMRGLLKLQEKIGEVTNAGS